jgi:hypothetical protein
MNWKIRKIKETNSAIAILEIKDIKKAKELKPNMIGEFPLPKPTMAGITESFDVNQIWDWCEGRELVGEPKLNGFRLCLVKDNDKIRILTDGLKERAKYYSDLLITLKKIPDSFIVDCSLGIERNGKPLPRIKLMTLQADEPQLEENDILVCTIFDIPYLNEDLHNKPFHERRKILEQFYNKYLKDSPNFDITKCLGIKGKSDLEKRFKEFAKLPQSEGIMVKDTKGIWPLDGRWDDVAKIKIEAEIKVIAIKKIPNKAGGYNYYCGLLPGDSKFTNLIEFQGKEYIDLGKTFNTKINANLGDILTIGVEEIIPQEEKLQWLGPRVIDIDDSRKEPYFANQTMIIAEDANILQKAEEGNIDYKIGDIGKAIFQIHIMGIEEEKVPKLKEISTEAISSRTNPTKLKMLFKGAVGEQGCHIDFRMVRKGDKFFEGGELMIGNLTGLDKFKKLNEGGKLRFGWKVARVEEPQAETIRGPVDWMEVGKNKIEIIPPGEVGATTNKYSAMLILDTFDFEIMQADEHAKKMKIKGGKLLGDCILLMAYVPITPKGEAGPRVWMISKLKEEEVKKQLEFRKFIPIFDVSKKEDEHIVAGVVYAPDEVDAQGDTATEEEIRKALYSFMESSQKFKINHEGKYIDSKVLEIYIAPIDFEINKQKIKKGSWVLVSRVLDAEAWKKIKSGEITGYSLAGTASSTKSY